MRWRIVVGAADAVTRRQIIAEITRGDGSAETDITYISVSATRRKRPDLVNLARCTGLRPEVSATVNPRINCRERCRTAWARALVDGTCSRLMLILQHITQPFDPSGAEAMST